MSEQKTRWVSVKRRTSGGWTEWFASSSHYRTELGWTHFVGEQNEALREYPSNELLEVRAAYGAEPDRLQPAERHKTSVPHV